MYSVLYVDDEPDLLELGKIYLERSKDFIVETAPSARIALNLIAARSFDAIVSDYQMPEMDGLQFLSAVRKDYPHLPFIIFTGRGREEVAVEAFERGADFYLQKGGLPIAQFTELIHKVQVAVDRRRAEARVSSLNRLYSMLSATDRAIVHIGTKDELLSEICRIVVEIGGFSFAWAGIADPFTHQIQPVATSGKDRQFLDGLLIPLDDTVSSLGPTGIAYRNQQPDICNDIASDERMKTIQKRALVHGYKALAAFPFAFGTPYSGVLTLYAPETGFFDDQITPLLEAMAQDITFALSAIDNTLHQVATEKELRRKNDELNAANEQITATDEELRANYEELAAQQQRILESEQRYRHLTEAVTDYIFTVRIENGRAVETQHGPGCEAVTGYTSDDFSADPHLWIRMVIDEDRAAVIRQAEAIIAGLSNAPLEHRIRTKNGSVRWVRNTPVPYTNPSGQIVAYDGLIQNITEQKLYEESLRDAKRYAEQLIATTNAMVIGLDTTGNIRIFNQAAEDITGYSRSDLLGKNWFETIVPRERYPQVWTEFTRLLSGGLPRHFENPILSKSGRERYILWKNSEVREGGKVTGTISFGIDITERNEAEKELKISEQNYREIFNAAVDAIVIHDAATGAILDVNPAMCRMWGYTREEALQATIGSLSQGLPPYSQEEGARKVAEALETGSVTFEWLCKRKSGDTFWAEVTLKRCMIGGKDRIMAIDRDITGRKQAEEALRSSEARYRAFFDFATNGIVVADAQTRRFLYANPAFCRMLGYAQEEIPSLRSEDIHSKQDLPFVLGEFHALVNGEKTFTPEIPCLRKDGTVFYADISASNVVIDGRDCIVGFFVDATGRKRAASALRHSNRQLNLLTRITRHDIHNKVTAIFGYLDLAKTRCTSSDESRYLDAIEAATRAIQDQIGFTGVYQQLGVQEPQWQDLRDVLGRIRLAEDVRMEMTVPPVEIFADLMFPKVFFNLIDNSLRHGEHVTDISISGSADQHTLEITYADNGTGIPEKDKERIFEQGYGKHTGLGLFLVREILSMTGITIRETGIPGKGARFGIHIPEGGFRIRQNQYSDTTQT